MLKLFILIKRHCYKVVTKILSTLFKIIYNMPINALRKDFIAKIFCLLRYKQKDA